MIETERLLLRKPAAADVEDPPLFLADPRVMDFLGGVEEPHGVVQQWLKEWETYPAGKFIVETSAGERIGRVGANFYDPVRWVRSASPDAELELTWALAHEHWGHGYATEAALAVRTWLDAPRVFSLITAANVRSQRVAHRLGARPGRTIELPGYGPHVVWTHPL
ncbi:MAG TPA: GNAT family N-acetyltransferase [Gaiellaceae bacterium]|nr:GNAT family N-acetyltransferase [Gaiellaceae bacterium]